MMLGCLFFFLLTPSVVHTIGVMNTHFYVVFFSVLHISSSIKFANPPFLPEHKTEKQNNSCGYLGFCDETLVTRRTLLIPTELALLP